ncbi:MAG: helix-turn-helix domain-containing protein, partial [Oligoflexales bacterium]|nr:helix-turn-helix domain-containing protein [Oligoflexales bacterium]
VQIAHKIELKANNKQKTYFARACGVSRFTYNWALNEWNTLYEKNRSCSSEEKEKISGLSLKKKFNAIKKEQFPWTKEVTKYAAQQPFIDLQNAFNRFFKKLGGKPKFKKKGQDDSFYVGGDQIKVAGRKIWVPNLGFVRLKESLRYQGKINSATFSRMADRWFVSIQLDTAEVICDWSSGLAIIRNTVQPFMENQYPPLTEAGIPIVRPSFVTTKFKFGML